MDSISCTSPCDQNPCGYVNIVQGYSKQYYLDLYYIDTSEPFDLTGVTEIVAAHPPATPGPPVECKLSLSTVEVLGAPGAGRILITLPAALSALVRINPMIEQFQDLQVSVTDASTDVTVFLMPTVLNILPPPYGVV